MIQASNRVRCAALPGGDAARHGAGSANRTEGSLWTAGSGGQGVELHGDFDWSVLVANETAGMDYCASPAIAGSTARGAAELSAAS